MLNRRQLLQALGLGAASIATGPRRSRADPNNFPTRIIFFVQPHGHVPNAWTMPVPGASSSQLAERSLVDLAREEFSVVLRPLHPFRDRLLAIEGLSHTSVLADIADIKREGNGGDANNHDVAVAGLLTGARALQSPGLPCVGGARSLDQEIALRTVAPGRFGSRVYGSDYVPNLTVAPFSFLGPGQASPKVADPTVAFNDLLGYLPAGTSSGPQTRSELIREMRGSVLDATAREYEWLAPKLGKESLRKLTAHRDLIRDLELSVGAPRPTCGGSFNSSGSAVTQFMRLIRLGLSCDLTRVITYVAPVPQCPEFGYPASTVVHGDYAHASVAGATSCGQAFSVEAERAMTDLGVWYANHFSYLLQELDSVPEGSGTLLDHCVVVWLTELATPTHLHGDAPVVLAGGANNFFSTGRYVRYPRTLGNPLPDFPRTGPAHNRLYVSLLQAMGQADASFGRTEAPSADGGTVSLSGPLTELHRS
jgi:Protein of unknown function (DUF1552)